MPFPFDDYPWAKFEDLNIAYMIHRLGLIISQAQAKLDELDAWKTATEQDLENWKNNTMDLIAQWEHDFMAEVNQWEQDTEQDLAQWKIDVLEDLNTWKTATTTVFEEIRVQAAASATAAAASATAAETARAAAVSAQIAAEQAASEISAEAAQIQTNTDDIADLKDAVEYTDDFIGTALTTDNYVDDTAWISGSYIDAANGAIVTAPRYSYQFVPLISGGTYATKRSYLHFGRNAQLISLHDTDHNYVKTITASQYDQSTGIAIFEFDTADILTAPYVGLSTMDNSKVNLMRGATYSENTVPKIWKVGMANHLNTRLYGGKLLCDGDSISSGVRDFPDNKGAWFGRLKSFNVMQGTNYSVSGGCITYIDSSTHCISRSIDTIHTDNAATDYLILEGGTNDADRIGRIVSGNIPANFGTWNETDFSGVYDDTTFCGAVDSMFYKAITYFSKSKIGFIIPPEMGGPSVAALTIQNRKAYFDEIVKIAAKWHIPVLDLWNISTMDARLLVFYDPSLSAQGNVDAGKYYYDGQHPTSAGYDFIQDKIQRWVESL